MGVSPRQQVIRFGQVLTLVLVYSRVYMYVYIYIHAGIHIHIHMHIPIHIHIYIHTFGCCVYLFLDGSYYIMICIDVFSVLIGQ